MASVGDRQLQEALQQTEVDTWRTEAGFSADVEGPLSVLCDVGGRELNGRMAPLNAWLSERQPCLFGRLAARLGRIHYCEISEELVASGDTSVRNRIQADRRAWKARAARGESSAFVIAVTSRRLAFAQPSPAVRAFASRLLELYLLKNSVSLDTIYLDDVEIDVPVSSGRLAPVRFDVGVNYFSAQGDKRWWHDHRMPLGMAFSMNSVGHLVKSTILQGRIEELRSELVGEDEILRLGKVDSLDRALLFAMQTIAGAAETCSGRATWLVAQLPGDREGCPASRPEKLSGLSNSEYRGYYHTDESLPSLYFEPTIERPANAAEQVLDFTYLSDSSIGNPDYVRAGFGLRVRDLVRRMSRRGDATPTSRIGKVRRSLGW